MRLSAFELGDAAMPNITREELQHLNALFGDIVKVAKEIKDKAPNCKGACEQIEQHGQRAFKLLNEIQARGSN
jgi:hypothetical protein